MEDERFKQLYRLEENLYIDSAPLIVEKGNLLLDRQTDKILIQLKFHSLSEKKIKALTVKLNTYYASGERHPETVEYQYLDLAVEYGDRFGEKKAILLKDNVIRSFTIASYSVVYYDKTVEEIKGVFEPLPFPKTLLGVLKNPELQKQYWLETSKDSMVVPIQYKKLWKCACGEWNLKDTCNACKCQKIKIFSKFNVENLTVAMNERLKKEAAEREEQKRREEEEAKRQEAIRQEEEIRRKKQIKTIRRIAAPVILVGIFAFGIYPGIIKPNMIYKQATELLSEEKYDDAIDVFESLGDYKDSVNMITEAQCLKAKNLVENKKYDKARAIYEVLGKENAEKEVTYQEARDLIDEERFKDAIDLLHSLDDKKSYDLIKKAKYGYGLQYMKEKNYSSAISIFSNIKEYKDSLEKWGECKYLLGLEYMGSGNYKAAKLLFKEINKAEISEELISKVNEKLNECEEILDQNNKQQAEKETEISRKNKYKIEDIFSQIIFGMTPKEVTEKFGEPDTVENEEANKNRLAECEYQYPNMVEVDDIFGDLTFQFEQPEGNADFQLKRVYWLSPKSDSSREKYEQICSYFNEIWGKYSSQETDNKSWLFINGVEQPALSITTKWDLNTEMECECNYGRQEDNLSNKIYENIRVELLNKK